MTALDAAINTHARLFVDRHRSAAHTTHTTAMAVTNMRDAPPTPILRCRTADITASAAAQRLINTVRHFLPSLSVTTLGVDHYWYSQTV